MPAGLDFSPLASLVGATPARLLAELKIAYLVGRMGEKSKPGVNLGRRGSGPHLAGEVGLTSWGEGYESPDDSRTAKVLVVRFRVS